MTFLDIVFIEIICIKIYFISPNFVGILMFFIFRKKMISSSCIFCWQNHNRVGTTYLLTYFSTNRFWDTFTNGALIKSNWTKFLLFTCTLICAPNECAAMIFPLISLGSFFLLTVYGFNLWHNIFGLLWPLKRHYSDLVPFKCGLHFCFHQFKNFFKLDTTLSFLFHSRFLFD